MCFHLQEVLICGLTKQGFEGRRFEDVILVLTERVLSKSTVPFLPP